MSAAKAHCTLPAILEIIACYASTNDVPEMHTMWGRHLYVHQLAALACLILVRCFHTASGDRHAHAKVLIRQLLHACKQDAASLSQHAVEQSHAGMPEKCMQQHAVGGHLSKRVPQRVSRVC